jgi:ribonuclease E
MANKMLIDASHPEETRVVVLRGNRVEEFDFESASKKQLRGNIYLAKVTRVEPSLQAAFVDYGGNRHGFLAFSEIHPDYYQIPVVDRQALIEDEARAQRDEEDDDARAQRRSRRFRRGDRNGRRAEKRSGDDETLSGAYEGPSESEAGSGAEAASGFEGSSESAQQFADRESAGSAALVSNIDDARAEPAAFLETGEFGGDADVLDSTTHEGAPREGDFERDLTSASKSSDDQDVWDAGATALQEQQGEVVEAGENALSSGATEGRSRDRPDDADEDGEDDEEHVEQLGGDAMEEVPTRQQRYRKQYKIQEVIKRRQVLLIQVVKEERGNKGAALTTYLSLAGRYSVLMPNTARGGGISRKITDSTDRQRLKSIAQELEVPEGMGVILRTAGAARTKAEVKRDFEYLLRMWETVRETTLQSTAPTLVYEEGSLIKRAIRDLYNKDIDEVVVAGDNGYREARDFMRLLMPSHIKNVQPYRDPQPIFAKSGAESQLDAMFVNQVTLKSGGYIVINQTEALVAIDVNSGRSTREHNIEDTALRTNLEAADEITRQLRLRDLAGLIVIDFIDMEEGRNNHAVERRLKDALKNDRARIQVGRISHFGLLEMSRQRIRTGVLEGSTEICPHCNGSGMLRSTSSIALHVLRVLEDALIKSASHDLIVNTRTAVALYILNQKRGHLRELEGRFGVSVTIAADDSLIGAAYYMLQHGELAIGGHEPLLLAPSEASRLSQADLDDSSTDFEGDEETNAAAVAASDDGSSQDEGNERREGESESDADNRRKRRRRRRRGRGGDREGSGIAANAPQPPDDALEAIAKIGGLQPPANQEANATEIDLETVESAPLSTSVEPPPAAGSGERRRPRRGGRSRNAAPPVAEPGSESEPEFVLEAEATETDLGSQAVVESEPPRRSRRAPRTRGPRRAVSNAEADASRLEIGVPAAQSGPADLETSEPPAIAAAAGDRNQAASGRHGAPPKTLDVNPQAAPASQSGPAADETAPHASGASGAGSTELEPTSAAQSQEQDPARPKRSGWWQRAKATLGG